VVDKEKANRIIDKLIDALSFYADPDTYFAIGILPDKPCGAFIDDMSEDHDGDYNRPMPGKLARQTLREIFEA